MTQKPACSMAIKASHGGCRFKIFMREMPEYKLAIFAAQSQNADIAALEELIFSMILKSNERTVLQAIFVNEDIESEASNEDVY